MIKYFLLIPLFISSLSTCQEEEIMADAYGHFEATETIVSAEANGKLLTLNVEEGQILEEGVLVAVVDSTQLYYQKLQLQAQSGALAMQVRSAEPQIEVLREQKKNLEREHKRVSSLFKAKAATQKQLDDLEGQIEVVNQQMATAKEEVQIVNRGILSGKYPLAAQIKVIDQQLGNCYVYNPIQGTVISKLAEQGEIAGFGTPLYKIANLEELSLRAYISGAQLPLVKIGQEVYVQIDRSDTLQETFPGKVSWVANEAEFTPKTIQTKSERVNLVYAVKVKVKNDGTLKIGMPGELWLSDPALIQKEEIE